MSETGKHQGVIAHAWQLMRYAEVEDILKGGRGEGANRRLSSCWMALRIRIHLGAIIRTANLAGAHGCHHPEASGSRSYRYSSKDLPQVL